MSDYTPKVGDRVRVTYEGEVKSVSANGRVITFADRYAVPRSVTLGDQHVERLPDPLPTEPGIYLDREGDVWRIFNEGEPLSYLSENAPVYVELIPEKFAPFTPLIPKGEK